MLGRNKKLATRIVLPFVGFALVFFIMAFATYYNLKNVNSFLGGNKKNDQAAELQFDKVQMDFANLKTRWQDLNPKKTLSESQISKLKKLIIEANDQFKADLAGTQSQEMLGDLNKVKVSELIKSSEKLGRYFENEADLDSDTNQEASSLVAEKGAINKLVSEMQNQLKQFKERLSVSAGPDLEIVSAKLTNSVYWALATLLFGIVFGGLGTFLIYQTVRRSIKKLNAEVERVSSAAVAGQFEIRGDLTKVDSEFGVTINWVNKTVEAFESPVNVATEALEKLSNRDLTIRIDAEYFGNHGLMKERFNLAMEKLQITLGQIAESVYQLSSASGQISSGSQSLAQGSSQQASSLAQISANLEEISNMLKNNLENTAQANVVAKSARENAEVGNEAMHKMTTAMEKIKSSADQTARILKTIDEIAFQTNLLALNAAVEAARAGDAGKGFAVVAEEVRNLAQRSADAAKNTTILIQESQENAANGVNACNHVSEMLKEIGFGVHRVALLINEIASAADEQSRNVEQITSGILELSKVTQQNSALAEQSASSSEELNAQSVSLTQLLNDFNIGDLNAMPRHSTQAANDNFSGGGKVHKLRPPRTSTLGGAGGASGLRQFNNTAKIPKEVAIPLTDEELKNL
jgi:methyl-accepting chemotaxis protein